MNKPEGRLPLMFGGELSCEDVFKLQEETCIYWILGFWSGLNTLDDLPVCGEIGRGLTPHMIYALVLMECRGIKGLQTNARNLQEAVFRVWYGLREEALETLNEEATAAQEQAEKDIMGGATTEPRSRSTSEPESNEERHEWRERRRERPSNFGEDIFGDEPAGVMRSRRMK